MNEKPAKAAAQHSDSVSDDTDRWVIVNQDGTVMYEDDQRELGWENEYEALHEARGVESRGERQWQVVRVMN